jgi:hypothetical protein
VLTAAADIELGAGFRTIVEVARTWIPGTDISQASSRGYAALSKRLDKWTPYLVYSFLRSAAPERTTYLAVNDNTVPAFIPGAALINASQRIGADPVPAWDQYSWAIGTSYSLTSKSKIKAEVLRSRIGQVSTLVDAPSFGNVRHEGITVFSLSYSFVH